MAKFKGRDLSLTFESDEVNLEATQVIMDNEDGDTDTTTFAELADGTPVLWFFTITAVSDYGAPSFWSFCWDQSGQEVEFLFKPYGNVAASATQPHFSGTATVNKKPPVGGTAGETFTFETRFDIDGTPTRVIA